MNKRISVLLLLFVILGSMLKVARPQPAIAEATQSEIILELTSGRILHKLNAEQKRPIASLTKILTAIVVLENTDIKRTFVIPKQCCGIEGSSIYLKSGDIYTIEDLLYGLMLRSGNDCAEALAVATAGSIKSFASKMNNLAKSIGANSSNFVNPHGLHNDSHYSTAADLGKIFAYGMKNKIFREIVSCKYRVITEINSNITQMIKNKNKLLFNYSYCTGGKTGYTQRAGRCLAASAKKGNMELISIVLGCHPTYEISVKNFERAYEEFNLTELCSPNTFCYSTNVYNGKSDCTGYITKSFNYPVKDSERNNIKITIECENGLCAPIKKDEKIGNMEIYLKNQLIFFQNIYSIIGVEKKFNILEPLEYWRVCYENKQISR